MPAFSLRITLLPLTGSISSMRSISSSKKYMRSAVSLYEGNISIVSPRLLNVPGTSVMSLRS